MRIIIARSLTSISGSWGKGYWDNDDALDWLDTNLDKLIKKCDLELDENRYPEYKDKLGFLKANAQTRGCKGTIEAYLNDNLAKVVPKVLKSIEKGVTSYNKALVKDKKSHPDFKVSPKLSEYLDISVSTYTTSYIFPILSLAKTLNVWPTKFSKELLKIRRGLEEGEFHKSSYSTGISKKKIGALFEHWAPNGNLKATDSWWKSINK